MDIEAIAKDVVDAAIKIHTELGPGLLESVYQHCMAYELRKRGYRVECEVTLPISYDGQLIEAGYCIDMLIEGVLVIENKTVEQILPVHESQLLTYLRLKRVPLGFILNWYTKRMKDGIRRMVNGYPVRQSP